MKRGLSVCYYLYSFERMGEVRCVAIGSRAGGQLRCAFGSRASRSMGYLLECVHQSGEIFFRVVGRKGDTQGAIGIGAEGLVRQG